MKTIMRSGITKAIAFILILACTAVAAVTAFDMAEQMDRGYQFDPNFEQSYGFFMSKMKMMDALTAATPQAAANELEAGGYLFHIASAAGESYADGITPETESYLSLPYWFKTEKLSPKIAEIIDTGNGETPETPEIITAPAGQVIDVYPADIIIPSGTDEITNTYVTDGNTAENTDNVPVDEQKDTFRTYVDENAIRHVVRDDGEYTWQSGQGEDVITDEYHEIYISWPGDWTIYAGMTAQAYDELYYDWVHSRESVMEHLYILIGLVILAIALIVYLLWVCGRRNGDGEIHTLLIDRFPVELTAAVGIGGSLMMVFVVIELFIENWRRMAYLTYPLCTVGMVAAAAIFVTALQSIVRNMKNRSFVSQLLSIKIVKLLWKFFVKAFKFAVKLLRRIFGAIAEFLSFLLGQRISVVVMVLFAAYFLLTALLLSMRMLFSSVVLWGIGEYVLFLWLRQADKIQEGIRKIRAGDTGYKIEGCTSPLLSKTADNLNSIGEAVKESVEREVSAQRMKTELITNVSHDLKTPLTSIISYADLLTGMELTPKEANDYAKIVKQKSDRLKKLTQDLFDISKAESGSDTVNTEILDMALLLRQSLAELNSEIEKSGLTFVTDIPEGEVRVSGDGKKLSRVFENLLVNALKYSMAGTRVYVSLSLEDGKAVAAIKNISAEPMNFDPAEITERFVRGDQARTTEGSGLGLAIARSYTELCGGKLIISVDGDLFKAEVKMSVIK